MEEFTDCPNLPWMIDFHSINEGKILNAQLEAAFASDNVDHFCKLNIDSEVPRKRLTGIMCTMGPSCLDPEILEKMMDAGMTMMKIKMSYYSHDECKKMFQILQKSVDNYSKKSRRIFPLGIAVDIKGPEIRIGAMKSLDVDHIELKEGQETFLTCDPTYEEFVTEDMIYVDYQKMNEIVEPGDKILINDTHHGQIRLSALSIVGSIIKCLIENTGQISNHASVCLEGIATDVPILTDFDIETLHFCIKEKVCALLMGRVENNVYLKEVKKILGKEGRSILVIAKIQNAQGVYNIDEILRVADGVVIDRSALSKELPMEKLFLVQKYITGKSNKVGIPVICASNILETLSSSTTQIPTNSEVTDVANAVMDGVDCFLLSRQTSVGDHPIEAIKHLATICKEAEAATFQRAVFENLTKTITPIEPLYAIAIAATEASMKCNAAAIIVATVTGRSAKVISRFRPRCPILAVTRYSRTAQILNIWRGVHPLHYTKKPLNDWFQDIDRRVQYCITFGKCYDCIKTGDALIIVTGARIGAGFTNSMKIVYASEFDTLKSN